MPTRDGEQRAERGVQRVQAGLGVAPLQKEVLGALRRLMTVDAAFFATADPETLLFTSAYAEEPLTAATPQFLDNEFGAGDVNRFAALATSSTPVATLDAATHADRWASARYRDIMRRSGWVTNCAPLSSRAARAGAICVCTGPTPR